MTMKTLIHILLAMLITATTSSVIAQTDTLQGSPLYHNATADPIEGERYVVGDIEADTIRTLLRELQQSRDCRTRQSCQDWCGMQST